MKQKRILSIDGGGIRGILPLCALMKLEEETGKLTRDFFSFAAGTSTGAIIAGGIAAGIPAKQLLAIYLERGKEVFPSNPFKIIKRIFKGYMYETQNLYNVISQELGDAKSWTINHSPIDLLITAKAVLNGKPWYFVKDTIKNAGIYGKTSLTDAITASTAAPTFFAPWEIKKIGKLIDGGVGVAGNPVYQACVEAFYYTNKYNPQTTTIISLGTGRFEESSSPTWIYSWFKWILGELLRSPGEQQTELVKRHFPESLFYRLDPDLKVLDPTLTKPIDLDDVKSIIRLYAYGQKWAQEVNWKRILEGKDTEFKIKKNTTQWCEYKK